MEREPAARPRRATEPVRSLAPLGYAATSIGCQIIAFGAALGLSETIHTVAQSPPIVGAAPLVALLGQALVAGALARWSRLPPVWQLLNLALPCAAWGALIGAVPTAPLAVVGIVALLLYAPTFWTRVPYYPTSTPTYAALLDLLPTDRPFQLLDIGCGFAPLLRYLAGHRPHGTFTGVEISPLAFLGAWLKSLPHHRVTIRWRSFWRIDLSRYDVVYAFLAPGPMPTVWDKVVREMRPGTVFISNTFPAPAEPDEVRAINDARGARLYIYRRPFPAP